MREVRDCRYKGGRISLMKLPETVISATGV